MPLIPNLSLDTRDDRAELHRLLERLPPRERVRFLAWACRTASLGKSQVRPQVAKKTRDLARLARVDSSADRRLALDIYFDLWTLAIQYEFSLEAALKELIRWVRVKGVRRGCSDSIGPVIHA